MDGPLKAGEDELVLYFAYGSFYSDKARIALLEKNLKFKEVIIDLDKKNNLLPWYIQICPEGTVPTLQHGEKFIPDSAAIINYIDATFGEPLLQPGKDSDIGRQVAELTEQLDGLKMGILTYGSIYHQDLIVDCQVPKEFILNRKARLEASIQESRKLSEENPKLKEVYMKKSTCLEENTSKLFDRSLLEAEIIKAKDILTKIEDLLQTASQNKFKFLFGDNLTTADIILSVTLNRLRMVGQSKVLFDNKLPHVTAYFLSLHERPSFKEVCAAFSQQMQARIAAMQQNVK